MVDFSNPLPALGRASSTVDKVAERVAQAGITSGDTVDLSAEAVTLMVARQNFDSNIRIIQAADEMTQNLLSLLG